MPLHSVVWLDRCIGLGRSKREGIHPTLEAPHHVVVLSQTGVSNLEAVHCRWIIASSTMGCWSMDRNALIVIQHHRDAVVVALIRSIPHVSTYA